MVMETPLKSLAGSEEGSGDLCEGGLWARRLASTMLYRPRQFEYHPTIPERMVVGTLEGQVVVIDADSNVVVWAPDDGQYVGSSNAILGLCWLRTQPAKFVTGASSGKVNIYDIQEGVPDIAHTYLHCGKTTSVHLNCTDNYLLSSGYSDSANITDVWTGKVVRKLNNIHEGHINISRFSNLNPNVFATCSFDRTAKMWDMRDPHHLMHPIYTCWSDSGHVMLCFSPDDVFLLTSAADNEITQYLAIDGKKHLKLNIPSTEKDDNFTRAYYTADSQHILSGCSDEPGIRLHCARTGDLVSCIEMYPGRQHHSLFIQSLRGDPHCCTKLSVLVNYKESCYPLEIVQVDLSKRDESIIEKEPLGVIAGLGRLDIQDCSATAGPPLSVSIEMVKVEDEDKGGGSDLHSLPSGQLALDLWGEGNTPFADCVLMCGDGTRVKAHRALLFIRCPAMFKICNFSGHCNEANMKQQYQFPVPPPTQELDYPFCDGSPLPPSHKHHHSSSGSNTSTDAHTQVLFLPESVHFAVIPIVLRYLYTDELHDESVTLLASGIEVGEEFDYLLALFPEASNLLQRIAVYERIYLASKLLQLGRLTSMVEVKCRDMIDVVSVIPFVLFSSRLGAFQLLTYCISFISTHLEVVCQLHGREYLPSGLPGEVQSYREMSSYRVDACFSCEAEGVFMGGNEPIPPSISSVSSSNITSSILFGRKTSPSYTRVKKQSYVPMPTIHTHWEHSSRVWQQPIKSQDLLNSLTSPLTGHTSTAMFSRGGECLFFLGGGTQTENRSYSHSRHILALEGIGPALKSVESNEQPSDEGCTVAVWTKYSSHGSPPYALAYHTATPLEPYDRCRRWVFVFGGSIDIFETLKKGKTAFDSWIFDVLTMTWTSVRPEGDVPSHRTRHSMVAMYSAPYSGEGGGLFTENPSFDYSSSSSAMNNVYAQLILFGGYDSITSKVFNDIHLLHVTYERSEAEWRNGDSSSLDYSPISSAQHFNFVWSRPEVTGPPPSSRLAHTACMIKNRFMVVFGGMGLGSVFNDVHILNVRSPSSMEWESVEVKGAPPLPRYGHSLVVMQDSEGFEAELNATSTSTLIMVGGTNGKYAIKDIFVLKIVEFENFERHERRWEIVWLLVELGMPYTIDVPLSSYNHTTLCDVSGKFIIYGGLDWGHPTAVPSSQKKGKEAYDTNTSVFILMPNFSQYQSVVFRSLDGSQTVNHTVLHWEWRKICTTVVVPTSEPPVLVKPSSFRPDLQRLLLSGILSDIVFSPGCNEGDVEKAQQFPVHRFIVAAQHGPLGAMCSISMKEMNSGHVVLNDISPSVLKALLTYLYTGTFDLRCPDEIVDLLATAKKGVIYLSLLLNIEDIIFEERRKDV